MNTLWLVIGGDFAANRAEVVGVYTNYKDAVAAANEAGYKVKDNEWFGCRITTIKINDPVRNVWDNNLWNGNRRFKVPA